MSQWRENPTTDASASGPGRYKSRLLDICPSSSTTTTCRRCQGMPWIKADEWKKKRKEKEKEKKTQRSLDESLLTIDH